MNCVSDGLEKEEGLKKRMKKKLDDDDDDDEKVVKKQKKQTINCASVNEIQDTREEEKNDSDDSDNDVIIVEEYCTDRLIKAQGKTGYFENLAFEILEKIFEFLSGNDLIHGISLVNRRFYEVVGNSKICMSKVIFTLGCPIRSNSFKFFSPCNIKPSVFSLFKNQFHGLYLKEFFKLDELLGKRQYSCLRVDPMYLLSKPLYFRPCDKISEYLFNEKANLKELEELNWSECTEVESDRRCQDSDILLDDNHAAHQRMIIFLRQHVWQEVYLVSNQMKLWPRFPITGLILKFLLLKCKKFVFDLDVSTSAYGLDTSPISDAAHIPLLWPRRFFSNSSVRKPSPAFFFAHISAYGEGVIDEMKRFIVYSTDDHYAEMSVGDFFARFIPAHLPHLEFLEYSKGYDFGLFEVLCKNATRTCYNDEPCFSHRNCQLQTIINRTKLNFMFSERCYKTPGYIPEISLNSTYFQARNLNGPDMHRISLVNILRHITTLEICFNVFNSLTNTLADGLQYNRFAQTSERDIADKVIADARNKHAECVKKIRLEQLKGKRVRGGNDEGGNSSSSSSSSESDDIANIEDLFAARNSHHQTIIDARMGMLFPFLEKIIFCYAPANTLSHILCPSLHFRHFYSFLKTHKHLTDVYNIHHRLHSPQLCAMLTERKIKATFFQIPLYSTLLPKPRLANLYRYYKVENEFYTLELCEKEMQRVRDILATLPILHASGASERVKIGWRETLGTRKLKDEAEYRFHDQCETNSQHVFYPAFFSHSMAFKFESNYHRQLINRLKNINLSGYDEHDDDEKSALRYYYTKFGNPIGEFYIPKYKHNNV